MTILEEATRNADASVPVDLSPQPIVGATSSWLTVAGSCALGAGAIHAAAIGVHAEHRPAALLFLLVAAVQLGLGAAALLRPNRFVAVGLAVAGVGAVAGWVVAKSIGIPFVAGLDVAEPVQAADALAAGLAAASVIVGLLALTEGREAAAGGPSVAFAFVGVGALTVGGMFGAGTHVHSRDHGGETVVASAVAPVPYDPAMPIDLGGVDGVTPQQQARAENLVADTILRLPRWSDPAVAEAAGFKSIGDAGTGHEHFLNAAFMNDDAMLDPERPESLVYDTSTGGRRLVAAMYMTKPGLPLDQVPDIGGKLTQWHIHDNLCYNAAGRVAGLTDAAGNCRPGLVKPVPTPMIHVWIESNPCGPFAALEGVGAGQIAAGETRLCDHVHGA